LLLSRPEAPLAFFGAYGGQESKLGGEPSGQRLRRLTSKVKFGFAIGHIRLGSKADVELMVVRVR
jgi:hypothetical protein